MASIRSVLTRTANVASLVSLGYAVIAIACVIRFRLRTPDVSAAAPPVTLLVPLHGLEYSLEANLRAFAAQRYSTFQIVFGVARDDDPALPVAQRIASEMPERDIVIAVGHDTTARNPKLANVLSMMRYAKHETLVLADSDTLVEGSYLRTVTAPLHNPSIGAVTALFCGAPDATFASRFGAMFMNEQFIPAALVERLIGGPLRHCFGPTNAFRTRTLEQIGGFEALAPHLADDYMLGNFIAARGGRVVISSYVVRTTISEPSIAALWTHELRWHRTIRGVSPLGYAGLFLTYPFTLALVALAFAPRRRGSIVRLALAVALRVILQRVAASVLDVAPAALWMTAPRDLFGFALWIWGYVGSEVRWRGGELHIANGDVLATQRGTNV